MVAIYARTASHDTEVLQKQIAKCMQKVGGSDLTIFQDIGVSGLATNKPQLDLLIEKSKCGSLKKVIVTDHSRFSRNPIDAAKIVKQLNDLGIEVVFTEAK